MNTKVTIPDTWLKQDFNKWIEKMSNYDNTRREIPQKVDALSQEAR